jgi:hypothetical protein
MRTDKEIIDGLEKIGESFIKISRCYNPDGVPFYGIRICSRQLEKPFSGTTLRDVFCAMLDAVDPPNVSDHRADAQKESNGH